MRQYHKNINGTTGPANQAQMQASPSAGRSESRYVTPHNFEQHSQAVKGWIKFNGNTNAIPANRRIGSVTDNGAGDYTFNFDVEFTSTDYCVVATVQESTGGITLPWGARVNSTASDSVTIFTFDVDDASQNDPDFMYVVALGFQ